MANWRYRTAARIWLDTLRWVLAWTLPSTLLRLVPARRLARPVAGGDGLYELAEAAGILDISEYDVLDLAYREHFDQEPIRRALDHIFTRYMLTGQAPTWAASFAAEVIDLYDRGELAEREFARHTNPPPTLRDIVSGVAQCILMVGVLWMIYVMFSEYPPH